MRLGRVVAYLLIGLGAVVMMLPFYWMVITAVSPAPDIIAFPPKWIPSHLTLDHFREAAAKAPNFASAFGVFLIRQAIKNIPMDLIDAARIDGAGEVRIVTTVVAPLIKATLATVAMLLFLSSWNDFLWPVIVINSQRLRTLPVGIALFKDPYGNINYGPLMAGTVITVGPMLLAYAFSQRFMIRGIATTGFR